METVNTSSFEDQTALRDWFCRAAKAWREAAASSGASSEKAAGSLYSLAAPAQICVFAVSDTRHGVALAATTAILTHDEDQPDLITSLATVEPGFSVNSTAMSSSQRLALTSLGRMWDAIQRNWSPDRSSGTNVGLPSAERVGAGNALWRTEGRIWDLPVDALAHADFRKQPPGRPFVEAPRSQQLVFESGQLRERRATLRWLDRRTG
jgi:hypothetical protein